MQMLKEINLARTNPSQYAEKIREYIKNINTNDKGKHFFNSNLYCKIKLPRGKEAFEECITYMKNLIPLNELILKEELKFPFPESNPSLSTNRGYITSTLLDLANNLRDKFEINWFHYDNNICNAEISTVLQLVDDSNSNTERRKHILDEKVKYVGVNVGKVNKDIHCIYLIFGS